MPNGEWFAGMTEPGDEIYLEFVTSDGTEVSLFLSDEQIPEDGASMRHDRTPPVHRIILGSAKALYDALTCEEE